MESIERFRKYMDESEADAGPDDRFYLLHEYVQCQLDEIEKEVAERYIERPKDRNGEPITFDTAIKQWGALESIYYSMEFGTNEGAWFVKGHDTSAPILRADEVEVAPPTVEDVLLEACKAYHGLMTESMSDVAHDMPAPSEIIAEYAAKLQLKEAE